MNVTCPLIRNALWFRSTVLLITKTSIIMYNVSILPFAFWVSFLFLADVRPNRINWNIDTWTKLWASETTPLETIQITNFDYSPPDQNHSWPHKLVKNLKSQKLRHGFNHFLYFLWFLLQNLNYVWNWLNLDKDRTIKQRSNTW